MTDLVAFLEARLRADEALARGATQFNGTDWSCPATGVVEFGPPDHELGTFADRDLAEHIARWDPARVLAETAAKRELIKRVMAWEHDYHDDDTWFSCSQALLPAGQRTDPEDSKPGSGCSDDSRRGQPCDCGLDRRRKMILLPLAAPHAAHEDFDERWRT